MITLTFVAIMLAALLAHVAGGSTRDAGAVSRVLASRAVVVVVFALTFLVLWVSWAAWNPIPEVHDEMAYVLQAQIFARGMWALPSPPLPDFWAQPHVLVEPALAAKYFPGHALLMTPGALLGWPALMPLVLQSTSGALLYVLARRVSSGAVAFLAWIIWLTSPMVLFFGPTYFSESTTTACWLAGWYALLEWRARRELGWLLAVALFTGWDAITRPLTGLAYAVPVGIVVLRDVLVHRRWRDFGLACAVGVLVLGILPLWSARTTHDWRVTPLALYTRMYMPYDVPGFGRDTTPPSHAVTPDLYQLNRTYSSMHVNHHLSALPSTFIARAYDLAVSIWSASGGVLMVFAVLGVLTLNSATAFAVLSGVWLLVAYLVYGTPPEWTLYYYETVPGFAYLTAAGLAWAVSMMGRPRGAMAAPTFHWRSQRWSLALAGAAVVLVLPGLTALSTTRGEHVDDRKALTRFDKLLTSIHDPKAVVFVRYAPMHNPHTTLVRNVANPVTERIWVVYDRGDAENARLLALAPARKAYLFDEEHRRTYLYEPTVAK
ncbi:hypothetical protein BH11GEM1_BH11GEM1_29920 [soil metagenome]